MKPQQYTKKLAGCNRENGEEKRPCPLLILVKILRHALIKNKIREVA
jgi:hypothetical protein